MLKVSEIRLKADFLLVEEEPVIVDSQVGTVVKAEEVIEAEKGRRYLRVGKVLSHGKLSPETLSNASFKGNPNPTVGELVGQNVIYSIQSRDPFDLPIENTSGKLLVTVNLHYIIGHIK